MLIATMFAVWIGAARAQEGTSGSAAFTETEAQKMALKWAELVSQGNVSELEKLLNDDYMHIHGTALVETKAQFLEAFNNGSRKYDPIKIEEMEIRVFGTSAVVTGKFNLKALARGKTIEGVNRFGLVLVKANQGQQVVSFQATALPQQK